VLDERNYFKVPLLRDPMGRVIDAPTSWFLHLADSGSKPLTLEKYAGAIRIFWEFLDVRPWNEADSALIREWRDDMEANKSSGRHINQYIDILVAFLVWAQETGRASRLVGATPPGGQPFPVRLVQSKGRNKRLVCDVRASHARRPPRLPVPDIDEVDVLYQRLTGPNEAVSERNCRMADLAVEAGLRREELLTLSLDQVPLKSAIMKHEAQGKVFRIKVIGKASKERVVPILPALMLRLRNHVDYHRKTLLGETTRIETAVFLSAKTGKRLTGSWVSKVFTQGFGSTKSQRLTLNRLRARFASLVVLSLARAEAKTRGAKAIREDFVLRSAAEVLGHADTETLRHYVDFSIRILDAEASGQPAPSDGLGVDSKALGEVARQNERARRRTPR
jgi:integrase